MSATKRGPYRGSLTASIERFYAENPGEWLTWDDLAAKFGCTNKQARQALIGLRKAGRLELEIVHVLRVKEAA